MQPKTFRTASSSGDRIAVYRWPKPNGLKGCILMVDTFSCYHMRLQSIAKHFTKQGYWVFGYDPYGHGQSDGKAGDIPNHFKNLTDLSEVHDFLSDLHPDINNQPTYYLGIGSGAIAASIVALKRIQQVNGLILVSPLLQMKLKPLEILLNNLVPLKYMPFLFFNTKMVPERLLRDPAEVQWYKSDPSILKRISTRYFLYIRDMGKTIFDQAANWDLPTCIVYSQKDLISNVEATEAFVTAAPAQYVTTHTLAHAHHFIFKDPDKQQALDAIQSWLAITNPQQRHTT